MFAFFRPSLCLCLVFVIPSGAWVVCYFGVFAAQSTKLMSYLVYRRRFSTHPKIPTTCPKSIQQYVRLLLHQDTPFGIIRGMNCLWVYIRRGNGVDGTNAIHGTSRMGPQRLKHSTNDQHDMARLIPDTKYVLCAVTKALKEVGG